MESPSASQGTIHRVVRGETLWSISRHYGVDLDALVRANQISDVSKVEIGRKLVIPSVSIRQHRSAKNWKTSDRDSFIWPVQGRVISIFGMRRLGAVNKGIDIQAPQGTDVVASRSGRVSFIHEALPGFGKTIILDHDDGFATVYAYVAEILVRSGDQVQGGQVIARVGKTGRTEVPALHFEIRRHQRPQNPFHYLP